jgi:NAD-specific glutamate dehydrogenase
MTIEHRLTITMTDDLRSLVGSRYLHDTVRVNLESDFNLREATGRWWDAGQLEFSEEIVVLRQRALTLVNLDQDSGLVIGGGRETEKKGVKQYGE